MREILFRGKRVDNGEWVKGYIFKLNEKLNPCVMLMNRSGCSYKVDTETIGQYTGLKDKYGVSIFEGDIIQIETFDTGEVRRATVEYGEFEDYNADGDSFLGWYVEFRKMRVSLLQENGEIIKYGEVVGNIHTTPELLEENK